MLQRCYRACIIFLTKTRQRCPLYLICLFAVMQTLIIAPQRDEIQQLQWTGRPRKRENVILVQALIIVVLYTHVTSCTQKPQTVIWQCLCYLFYVILCLHEILLLAYLKSKKDRNKDFTTLQPSVHLFFPHLFLLFSYSLSFSSFLFYFLPNSSLSVLRSRKKTHATLLFASLRKVPLRGPDCTVLSLCEGQHAPGENRVTECRVLWLVTKLASEAHARAKTVSYCCSGLCSLATGRSSQCSVGL